VRALQGELAVALPTKSDMQLLALDRFASTSSVARARETQRPCAGGLCEMERLVGRFHPPRPSRRVRQSLAPAGGRSSGSAIRQLPAFSPRTGIGGLRPCRSSGLNVGAKLAVLWEERPIAHLLQSEHECGNGDRALVSRNETSLSPASLTPTSAGSNSGCGHPRSKHRESSLRSSASASSGSRPARKARPSSSPGSSSTTMVGHRRLLRKGWLAAYSTRRQPRAGTLPSRADNSQGRAKRLARRRSKTRREAAPAAMPPPPRCR
jgi:hypothetical protein